MSCSIDRATEAIHTFHQLQTFTGGALTMMLNYEKNIVLIVSLIYYLLFVLLQVNAVKL
jgi:hypothetical protein